MRVGTLGLCGLAAAGAWLIPVAGVAKAPPPVSPLESDAEVQAAAQAAMAYYPEKAMRDGVQGSAVLLCGRDAHLAYRDCRIAEEQPQGYDFGAAALRLAGQWRDNPRVNVAAVPGGRRVAFAFCLKPPGITPNPLLPQHIQTLPDWLRVPHPTHYVEVYPTRMREANAGGRVTLACVVKADTSVRGCTVVDETPPGEGFGAAALKLTQYFNFKPMTVDGVPVDDAKIRLPVLFGANPPPAPPSLPTEPPPRTAAEACDRNAADAAEGRRP